MENITLTLTKTEVAALTDSVVATLGALTQTLYEETLPPDEISALMSIQMLYGSLFVRLLTEMGVPTDQINRFLSQD